jgi:hypothetical protein
MKNVKNSPLAFRFDPEVKEALAVISQRDGRSMANMMEWLIRKHCEREALGWPVSPESAAASNTLLATKQKTNND